MKYFKNINNTLTAKFAFENFQEALKFINNIWNIAESSNHHPDILLHDYKYVTITTTTHDAGNKITQKDYTIAEKIESHYIT